MTAIGDWTRYQLPLLIALSNGRATSVSLANTMHFDRKEVSRHLQTMKRRRQVACNGRSWSITERGRKELPYG